MEQKLIIYTNKEIAKWNQIYLTKQGNNYLNRFKNKIIIYCQTISIHLSKDYKNNKRKQVILNNL
jgi:hypothetical protein